MGACTEILKNEEEKGHAGTNNIYITVTLIDKKLEIIEKSAHSSNVLTTFL